MESLKREKTTTAKRNKVATLYFFSHVFFFTSLTTLVISLQRTIVLCNDMTEMVNGACGVLRGELLTKNEPPPALDRTRKPIYHKTFESALIFTDFHSFFADHHQNFHCTKNKVFH